MICLVAGAGAGAGAAIALVAGVAPGVFFENGLLVKAVKRRVAAAADSRRRIGRFMMVATFCIKKLLKNFKV